MARDMGKRALLPPPPASSARHLTNAACPSLRLGHSVTIISAATACYYHVLPLLHLDSGVDCRHAKRQVLPRLPLGHGEPGLLDHLAELGLRVEPARRAVSMRTLITELVKSETYFWMLSLRYWYESRSDATMWPIAGITLKRWNSYALPWNKSSAHVLEKNQL